MNSYRIFVKKCLKRSRSVPGPICAQSKCAQNAPHHLRLSIAYKAKGLDLCAMSWKSILWEGTGVQLHAYLTFKLLKPISCEPRPFRLSWSYIGRKHLAASFKKHFQPFLPGLRLIYGAPFTGHTRPVRNGGNVSTRSRLGKFGKYISRLCWQIEETVGGM